MKLSVVVPCFNERSTIRTVIARVLEQPFDIEIVAVDDGSTDGTRDELEEAARADARVRIFFQPKNMGKGAALRRGFREARGEIVLVQDADLEYNPSEYGRLVKPIEDGVADAVFGSRFLSGDARRVLYYWHYVGNRFLTELSNMLTDLNLSDMETCYKVFRRELLDQITLEEDRFGIEPELTAKIAAIARTKGYRVYEVGISYSGRTYEEGKKITWKDGVSALRCILKYNLRR